MCQSHRPNLECSGCNELGARLKRLRKAKFTLIVPTGSDTNGGGAWSVENTFRLIEAISCSTVPVLVGMDLEPPLEGLIAWSELVVQVPVARLPHLTWILMSFDRAQLAARQIKAANIYKSYFASDTAMLRALLAAVQYRLNLAVSPLDAYAGKIISFSGWLCFSVLNQRCSATVKAR